MASSEILTVAKPAPPAIVAELRPVVEMAKAFAVVDFSTDRRAQEIAHSLRRGERAVADHFEPARKAVDLAKKEILQARDALIAPLVEARSYYERASIAYAKAEAEKAERIRREAQAAAQKAEEERALMDAIAAEEEGDTAAAEAILEAPIEAPRVHVAPEVAKVEGTVQQTRWRAQVVDVRAALRFLLEREEWTPLLERLAPEIESGLTPMARAQRQALAIPGVKAVPVEVRGYRT